MKKYLVEVRVRTVELIDTQVERECEAVLYYAGYKVPYVAPVVSPWTSCAQRFTAKREAKQVVDMIKTQLPSGWVLGVVEDGHNSQNVE